MGGCASCGDGKRGRRIMRVARGAAGIARSVLGVGHAPVAEQERRMRICEECPEAVRCAPYGRQVCKCRQCGCFLTHKTRLLQERCPLQRW